MSNKAYVEVALYKLKSEVEEVQFLVLSAGATAVFEKLAGFVRRELMRSEDGRWVDLAYWQNRELAKQAEPTIYEDATIAKVMALLDSETMIFTHAQPIE